MGYWDRQVTTRPWVVDSPNVKVLDTAPTAASAEKTQCHEVLSFVCRYRVEEGRMQNLLCRVDSAEGGG